jgi:hypothetical protein
MLAVLFALLAQDEIFILGEVTFKEAQEHFEKREWFDAILKAEKARNMFLALEDLYASQNKKSEQKDASEYVKRCNQLIKLATDARFAEKKPEPAPKQAPPPPPPPEPKPVVEPPKNLLPQSVVDFKRVAAGEVAPDNAEVIGPMLVGLKALDGPWKTWGQVARLIAARWIRGEFKPSEALKEYAVKFLPDPMKFDHRGAAKFLIEEAEKVSKDLPAWRQLRWLALAHVAEALSDPDSPLVYELPAIAESVDLVKEGGRESWPTREGNLIELTHMAKDISTIKDPLRHAYRAIYLFERIAKPADVAACKAACQNIDPDLAAALKARLDAAKPCKWCSGTHSRKCDGACSDGKKQLTCSRCNGLGYMMTRGGTQPCPEQPPKELTQPKRREGESEKDFRKRIEDARRRPAKNEKHTWLVDCPKCQGTEKIECKDCKEPWSMKKIESAPCESCRSSGWLIERVKLPCPDCYGIGHRLKK